MCVLGHFIASLGLSSFWRDCLFKSWGCFGGLRGGVEKGDFCGVDLGGRVEGEEVCVWRAGGGVFKYSLW